MMSRFNQLFKRNELASRPALIPFLMLGDPTPELSLHIIQSVIDAGVDAIELGIPFSDPIADGPEVCKASQRALESGMNLQKTFEILKSIRTRNPIIPIGLLVYANLVYQYGLNAFYQKAAECGVDAVLLPDVPTDEVKPFSQSAKKYDIDPILLATPACQESDLALLPQLCEGFTYVVTRKGVTGIEYNSDFSECAKLVDKLDRLNAPPAVFGFGIKNTQDIQIAYEHGAKGVIIGSALIHALSHMPVAQLQQPHRIVSVTKQFFGI